LTFHAWMLTSKTTSPSILFPKKFLAWFSCFIFRKHHHLQLFIMQSSCFLGGPDREKKLQGQTLTCSLVFVCAAIQELGIQPYNEDLHLGELRYVQVRFCSFLGKSCLISSFGTPDHKHGPNGPEGM
jgi:hypothetical protein